MGIELRDYQLDAVNKLHNGNILQCKHKDLDSAEDPCDECLSQPWNTDSRKPVNFEEEGK